MAVIVPYVNNLSQYASTQTGIRMPNYETDSVAINREFYQSLTTEIDVHVNEALGTSATMITDAPTNYRGLSESAVEKINRIVRDYCSRYTKNISNDFVQYYSQTSTLDFDKKQVVLKYINENVNTMICD